MSNTGKQEPVRHRDDEPKTTSECLKAIEDWQRYQNELTAKQLEKGVDYKKARS